MNQSFFRPASLRPAGRWGLVCLAVLAALALAPGRAQPPRYRTTTVTFTSAGTALAGTLFLPRRPAVAAVVLVHGSGQEPRQLGLAEQLAKHGIAVLTYDKRGVGASGGVYVGPEVGTNNVAAANLHLLATDASAALTTLVARLPARHGPVGLLGGSQAGWIMPLAAQQNPAVRFLVLFSGPVVRDRYDFADTDARALLATLTIPGLWLFGGQNIQAPVRESMANLDTLRTQGRAYHYQLFPALGHNTAFAESKEPLEAAIRWLYALPRSNNRVLRRNGVE
jgi:alpha-beta hydrolase superfamily lysophospholipase